jgi:hypothetical protein
MTIMTIINILINSYKTIVDVLKDSGRYHKQRSWSIVHKSFKNKHLNMQINLTYTEKLLILVV